MQYIRLQLMLDDPIYSAPASSGLLPHATVECDFDGTSVVPRAVHEGQCGGEIGQFYESAQKHLPVSDLANSAACLCCQV